MSKHNIFLLVGGPHDGERVIQEGTPEYIRKLARLTIDRPGEPPLWLGDIEQHTYLKKTFCEGESVLNVYYHQSIQQDFLAALLRGYRRASGL